MPSQQHRLEVDQRVACHSLAKLVHSLNYYRHPLPGSEYLETLGSSSQVHLFWCRTPPVVRGSCFSDLGTERLLRWKLH